MSVKPAVSSSSAIRSMSATSNNNPQSAYALHILNNKHEYDPIDKTMSLLKPIKSTSLLFPYELFFIQSLHKAGRLISKQNPGDPHTLLQLAINPSHLPS
jgi:hypothetical protein